LDERVAETPQPVRETKARTKRAVFENTMASSGAFAPSRTTEG
jgi:hypothetical protein